MGAPLELPPILLVALQILQGQQTFLQLPRWMSMPYRQPGKSALMQIRMLSMGQVKIALVHNAMHLQITSPPLMKFPNLALFVNLR